MLPRPSEWYEPVLESVVDEDMDPNPCEEDEEFFKSRPNAEEMEQAIRKKSGRKDQAQEGGWHMIKWSLPFLEVYTSLYQSVTVCTSMYFESSKLD